MAGCCPAVGRIPCPRPAKSASDAARATIAMTLAPLSPREQELARLIADDLSDRECAAIMQITPYTVRRHLERISAKLAKQLDPSKPRRRAIRLWVRQNDQ